MMNKLKMKIIAPIKKTKISASGSILWIKFDKAPDIE
jgi:hypothetical protein